MFPRRLSRILSYGGRGSGVRSNLGQSKPFSHPRAEIKVIRDSRTRKRTRHPRPGVLSHNSRGGGRRRSGSLFKYYNKKEQESREPVFEKTVRGGGARAWGTRPPAPRLLQRAAEPWDSPYKSTTDWVFHFDTLDVGLTFNKLDCFIVINYSVSLRTCL